VQLTTAIDDMTPTALAYVQSQLMEAGALDVYLRPIVMKKGRAGHEMLILASEKDTERMLNILARESTTLGIRYERIRRHIADREYLELEHEVFGLVHAKRISHGSFSRTEFEYEDVKRIALENSLPLREVYDRLKSCITES
jgi:pyridinium-3,5-bisthiocarboxylic acid mononucleotide nickel chelatase